MGGDLCTKWYITVQKPLWNSVSKNVLSQLKYILSSVLVWKFGLIE